MAKMTVAALLVKVLELQGVKRIYGVCGDSLNGITETIRTSNSIEWVHTRHEETAAFAAGAEAQLTGDLTVCAGSCGPGNLHLINGLYDCHRSRVPVLAIAAQIPSQEIGSGYFQETDPAHLFAQCSHYCATVTQADQMPRLLEIAIRHAVTMRGVAVLVLPGDVALADAESDRPRLTFPEPTWLVQPDPTLVADLAKLLNSEKKVSILAGIGCAGAHEELIELAQKLQAPIIHTMRGKEHIEYDNPCDVGMTGLLGFSSGYHAMKDCDILLMVGADFPYRQFFPTDAKIAQIDSRGEQIGKRCKVDLAVIGDAKLTMKTLLPTIEGGRDSRHLTHSRERYQKSREGLDDLASTDSKSDQIHPQYLTKVIDELAADDAIFTCDVGTPTVWASRYLKMNGKRRLLGSFVHGSMAGALPQAIGAQLAYPDRQVVALCGDGGLAMCLGDLLSLQQLQLPIKIVVFKNDSLAFVELEMKAAGLLDFATDLVNPSFAKIAEASGVLGLLGTVPGDVRPVLEQGLAHVGPALMEVSVARQELSMPPTITRQMASGFGLFMLKAVLDGRGTEVLDLAKVNLFR